MERRIMYDDELESLEATELSLAPPGTNSIQRHPNKRPLASETDPKGSDNKGSQEPAPSPKTQVVGWPPVRSSFRRNTFQQSKKAEQSSSEALAHFVKVSMDGAPYLRKIDLNAYKGYKELRHALDDMFKCFSIGSECVIAYEDKDGDWMLAGDVPWEMFISSCKRLRIMKGADARGLGSGP